MDRILMAHGGGGSLTNDLIRDVIVPALGSAKTELADASPVPGRDDILFTTDSFVVKPLFFPGGDIGSLAVHGTVNDLAVSGARPLAISISPLSPAHSKGKSNSTVTVIGFLLTLLDILWLLPILSDEDRRFFNTINSIIFYFLSYLLTFYALKAYLNLALTTCDVAISSIESLS